MKTLTLLFVTIGASCLFGSTVYLNTTTDLVNSVQYKSNGYTAFGDQITLGGTDRQATQATTQFFNFDLNPATFSATLSFYTVGSGGSVVGTLLGTYTVNGISITGLDLNDPASGLATVIFPDLNVAVPDDLIFALSVSNISTGSADLGVELYDPPTIGSSDNGLYISAVGSTFSNVRVQTPGFGNLNFSLTATPEPATLSIIAAGLAVLALASRRKLRS